MSQFHYRFRVEYDGAKFHGWQVQRGQISVQEVLEESIRVMTREKTHVMGSGRTDTGVHARGQVAKFSLDKQLVNLGKAENSLNGILPSTISIRDLQECSADFQPRFDALWRYYIYTVHTRKSSLNRDFAWHLKNANLDLELMNQEAQLFLGEHDFLPFSIPRNDGKSTLCNILECRIEPITGGFRFHVRGNRFLHRMVRSILGCLVDVGRGQFPAGTTSLILAGKYDSPRTWAPPYGLVLEDVGYKDY